MAPKAAHAAEKLETALDYSNVPPFWKRKNGLLLYFVLTSSFFSSLASGFDGSMTNAMQLLPVWQDEFGHPTGSALGLFGASTGIGGVIPLIFLNWLPDYLGRKWPTVIGAITIIGSAIMQTFSTSLNMFIGAKMILGFGTSVVQMGAPVLITELSHPKERAIVTSLYNTSVVLGYVIRVWATFGSIKIDGQWQWKLPTLLQAVPSLYQLAMIYFSPESSRWLVAHGHPDEALEILIKYHGEENADSTLVRTEFDEIKEAIALDSENNITWKQFFASTPNLKRIAICTAVAVFSQSTGNLLVSNYLSPILKQTGLDSEFESTLINGMVTLWSYIISIICCFLMNTFRRRTFFLWGSGGTLITLIVWTVGAQQYTETGNIAAGRLVIACIFFFQLFYVIAWQVLVVTYPLEICIYQNASQDVVIFGNYVNPIGLENIETMGPTLEELEAIFHGPKEKSQRDVEKIGMEKEEVDHEEVRVDEEGKL
ncbi:MFS general substrate transporter [Cadophora sp. DSE1049]|nr:MFS general substrate transporter [Cadophora sp. DSE1049]